MIAQNHLLPPDVADRLRADRELLRDLRAAISRRIERDMTILDALLPDADDEDDTDTELTAAEWSGCGVHRFNVGGAA